LSKIEISPGVCIGRINPYRVVELLDRFFIIPKLSQSHAQAIMRIGVCRVKTHGLGKLLYRFGQLMRIHINLGHLGMGHCLIGIDGQGETKFLDRFLLQTLSVIENT